MTDYKWVKINIGKAIKFYRQQNGLKQWQLAELTGISQSYLSEIERGKKVPSFFTLIDIADKIGVDFWDLLIPLELPMNVKTAIKLLLQIERNELDELNKS